MTDFNPTDEQVAIRDGFRSGENLKINAGAGTGKTATLRLLAEEGKPTGRNGIYLAFNKPIAEEAQRKFQGTPVVAKTLHSLAYREFGAPRAHRMNGKRYMRWTEKAVQLGIGSTRIELRGLTSGGSTSALSAQQLVRMTEDAVSTFCHSADDDFNAAHISFEPALRLNAEGERVVAEKVIEYARRYWKDIENINGELRFTHDHYMKLYALSRPQLPYDFILLDEAQDTDPLMIGLIEDQKDAQIVVVGDRAQAIYGWRGAVSAMDAFGGGSYDLSQSFRFGEDIAEYANRFLALLGDFRLTGASKPSSVYRATVRQPEAILTRTNMGALVELTQAQRGGFTTAIGGRHVPQELRKLAEAAKQLHDNGKTGHRDLEMFSSWRAVQDYADHEADMELKKFVKLIDEYGADSVVNSIDACVPDQQARTLISTAHAAKGLEWLQVKVADDFRGPRNPEEVLKEEVMLSYVAVTRAQRHLDPLGVEWVEDFEGKAVTTAGLAEVSDKHKETVSAALSAIDINGIFKQISTNKHKEGTK